MSIEEIYSLSERMRQICWDVNGFGVSAVQVGEPVCIFGFVQIKRSGLFWMTDPEIISAEGKSVFTEGCLSLPGYFWNITRPDKITVSYKTLDGEDQIKTFSGMESRIIQHEMDHLDGLLIPDFMTSEQRVEFDYNFENKISIYDYESPELIIV